MMWNHQTQRQSWPTSYSDDPLVCCRSVTDADASCVDFVFSLSRPFAESADPANPLLLARRARHPT